MKKLNIKMDLKCNSSIFKNKLYWEVSSDNDSEYDNIQFYFFIERINNFKIFQTGGLFLVYFVLLNLFFPFLTIIFKEKNYIPSLRKFEHPQYLISVCEYLLIERYKLTDEKEEK